MSHMIDIRDPLTSKNFMVLKGLVAVYVLGLVISHATFPAVYVWAVAAFFSITMNFTYPWAALKTGRFFTLEAAFGLGLIWLAILGVFASPLFVIASIFLHGVWDLFKHHGAGVPFLKWYTQGCVLVDWSYSAVLLLYFLTVAS